MTADRLHRTLAVAVGLALAAPCRAGLVAQAASVGGRPDSAATSVAPKGTDAQPRITRVARPTLLVGSRGALPLSARRAFLYSLGLPGLGQSRLQRGTAGALFASVELAAIVMVRRSSASVLEARRYRADSLPSQFTVQGTTVVPGGSVPARFDADLERTRRLHVEDWIAVVAFNHLLAGADAFVSAQLWDMPVRLTVTPSRGGAAVVASLAF